jgi:hypothetical protein
MEPPKRPRKPSQRRLYGEVHEARVVNDARKKRKEVRAAAEMLVRVL